MIHKQMTIEEVVQEVSGDASSPSSDYGLGCVGCQAALFENIEQGAKVHGIDVDALIVDLNKQIQKD